MTGHKAGRHRTSVSAGEDQRAVSEEVRSSAELARETAEVGRQQNERARLLAEGTRLNHERHRDEAATLRSGLEENRAAAEQLLAPTDWLPAVLRTANRFTNMRIAAEANTVIIWGAVEMRDLGRDNRLMVAVLEADELQPTRS